MHNAEPVLSLGRPKLAGGEPSLNLKSPFGGLHLFQGLISGFALLQSAGRLLGFFRKLAQPISQ